VMVWSRRDDALDSPMGKDRLVVLCQVKEPRRDFLLLEVSTATVLFRSRCPGTTMMMGFGIGASGNVVLHLYSNKPF
jgi:hypothetical protein